MKLLLDRGADVNAVESTRGQTALMWAIAHKHPEVAKLLLDAGARIERKQSKAGS